jgi:hypothetical protein
VFQRSVLPPSSGRLIALINKYQSARRHNPEDSHLHTSVLSDVWRDMSDEQHMSTLGSVPSSGKFIAVRPIPVRLVVTVEVGIPDF